MAAYAWLKCEKEEDKECYGVLKKAGIIGRNGTLFGANSSYVRLSLIKTQDDFDILLHQINKLVSEEDGGKSSMWNEVNPRMISDGWLSSLSLSLSLSLWDSICSQSDIVCEMKSTLVWFQMVDYRLSLSLSLFVRFYLLTKWYKLVKALMLDATLFYFCRNYSPRSNIDTCSNIDIGHEWTSLHHYDRLFFDHYFRD